MDYRTVYTHMGLGTNSITHTHTHTHTNNKIVFRVEFGNQKMKMKLKNSVKTFGMLKMLCVRTWGN